MVASMSRLRRVPPATLRSVLRGCAIHKSASTEEIARSCGMGEETAVKALLVLSDMGLVSGDSSSWTCVRPDLNRSSDDATVDEAMRDALLAYRPFESICEGLVVGESFGQAARHTAVALGLGSREEANLGLLKQWGTELGILTGTEPVALSPDLRAAVEALAANPVAGVSSNAEARLYVSSALGRDAFDQLDEVDRSLLARAVTECDGDPSTSVEASGQALEDYLRELCGSNGLAQDAAKVNGAGQLGGLLRQNNLIHPHHVKLIDSASTLRNAKAHKKDKQTVTPWTITPLGARTAFGMAVLAIESIHDWVSNGRQIL